MKAFVAEILVFISLILTGASISKPVGWVVVGLALLGLLLITLGGIPTR